MPSAENSPRLAQTGKSLEQVGLSTQIYTSDFPRTKEKTCKYRDLKHKKNLGEDALFAQIYSCGQRFYCLTGERMVY